MTRDVPSLTKDSDGHTDAVRRIVVKIFLVVILLQPAIHLLQGPRSGLEWFQLAGALALTGIVLWQVTSARVSDLRTSWPGPLMMLALAIALFVIGGPSWVAAPAVAAAMCGRYIGTPVPALAGAIACSVTGLILAAIHHYSAGNIFSVLVIAPLAALFSYSAATRVETTNMLRRTRAELARAAVAEERLRIARDLHDLLGHSLSLITLKAELAGRVIDADPQRAAREIAELESVARQSLSDVREAVAGFRQPDLADELVAARHMLDAAGISAKVDSIDTGSLPQDVDAALAWAVREGTTNVVRHSRATEVSILVSAGPAVAVAEISDNGPTAADEAARLANPAAGAAAGPAAGPDGRGALIRARPAFAGSGLAGLAERVRALGGELAAGAVDGRGFLLRVVVPLSRQA
jgi:two-component system, NarL family, sensor histidine kinase DesK